jgi:hypothetical protein
MGGCQAECSSSSGSGFIDAAAWIPDTLSLPWACRRQDPGVAPLPHAAGNDDGGG